MHTLGYLAIFAFILVQIQAGRACKGCIAIDEHNIGKIVPKFKATLVKFDIAYPYGDKHDAFVKFADEVTKVTELIVAEVGVKDYGEKENAELAKKYGVKTKDDLPKVRLFLGGFDDPVPFTNEYTLENFRDFVRDNTDLYLGLPGCVERYDALAKEFVAGNRKVKYEEAQKLAKEATDEEKISVQTYLLFMKKIVDNGIGFVQQEQLRLSKIVKEGKINDKKKAELSQRLNILHSFKPSKDEL